MSLISPRADRVEGSGKTLVPFCNFLRDLGSDEQVLTSLLCWLSGVTWSRSVDCSVLLQWII